MAGSPESLSDALRRHPVVLDGGLATQLEAAGHDLSDELWSARLLADDPEAIMAAHRAFLDAGASVITTASYQASIEGFGRRGYDRAAAATLIRRSVELAKRACDRARNDGADRPLWIAASVGPYGAVLADGSEYRGDYGLTLAELVRFHRPRLEILADAGPDVLALETVPDVREAEALLAALDGLGLPAWLSYTVAGDRTRAGQPLEDAASVAAAHPDVIAVGVNCSAPADATAAVTILGEAGKPVVIYPNSGETWDPARRRWVGRSALTSASDVDATVAAWIANGARLLGGCCRVMPADIELIAARVCAVQLGPGDRALKPIEIN